MKIWCPPAGGAGGSTETPEITKKQQYSATELHKIKRIRIEN